MGRINAREAAKIAAARRRAPKKKTATKKARATSTADLRNKGRIDADARGIARRVLKGEFKASTFNEIISRPVGNAHLDRESKLFAKRVNHFVDEARSLGVKPKKKARKK